MLSAESLKKAYGHQTALSSVSFAVPEGQIVGILGINGAGKSTLLNILTGCLVPDAGEVKWDGFSISREPMKAKSLIGYLPEQCPMYDELTVREFLFYVCRLKRVVKQDISSHVHAVASCVGIQAELDRRIGNLSKGYRQRVGLAQALCSNPKYLVLDEPTVGLDPMQTAEFRKLLRSLAPQKTILFSTHLLHEAEQVCDRVLILHHGRIIADRGIHSAAGCCLHLTLSGCGKDLFREIKALPSVEKAEMISGSTDRTLIRIACSNDGETEKSLFTLCVSHHTPIIRLEEKENSLEDIFLMATGSAEKEEQV